MMSKTEFSQELSLKSSALFKALVRSQQFKQYKKALKIAEQILKSNPTHGETLSIKALVLRSTGNVEEAYELAKLAIKYAPMNCLCWKMYGYMYQEDKEYDKAINCYSCALNCDETDIVALRDCSALLLHKKRYKEYMEMRKNVISKSHKTRYSDVLELAFAAYLQRDIDLGLSLLNTFEKSCNVDKTLYTDTSSCVEYPLECTKKFKIMLLQKKADYNGILEVVNSFIEEATDKDYFREVRVDALLKLKKLVNAEADCWVLISHNNDNIDYLMKLMASRNIHGFNQNNDEELVNSLFDELEAKFPKSSVIWQLPLSCLKASSKGFVKTCEKLLKYLISKNIPSIFRYFTCVHEDKDKVSILLDLALKYNRNLESTGCIESVENDNLCELNKKTSQPKSVVSSFWIKNFIAQSHCKLSNFSNAMKTIKEAIELCPNSAELYETMATIYEACGNNMEALNIMLKAETLDNTDRYLKYKITKYALKAGQLSLAESTANKIALNSTIDSLYTNMNNMQFIPFFYDVAVFHLSEKKYEIALARFYGIIKQLQRYRDDCLDFYYLSSQKVNTLLPFLELSQNFSDFNYVHAYVYSAMHIANIYILLHDKKIANNTHETTSDSTDFKPQTGIKNDTTNTSNTSALNKQTTDGRSGKNHLDSMLDCPLFMEKEPLEKASALIHDIICGNTKYTAIYETGYQLYLRKKKIIIATRCLTKIKECPLLAPKARFLATELSLKLISPSDPLGIRSLPDDVYNLIIKYVKSVVSDCPLENVTKSPITEEYLVQENLKYIESNIYNPLKLIFSIKCFSLLNNTENVDKYVKILGENKIKISNYGYEQCVEVCNLIEEMATECNILENFKSKMAETFTFSTTSTCSGKAELNTKKMHETCGPDSSYT